MSGLLVAYLAFIELERKRFNLVMFYVLRYIRWRADTHSKIIIKNRNVIFINFRLTIPLAFVIGFNITLAKYFVTEGPYSWNTLGVGGGCEEAWWDTILYIANLTGRGYCLGQTWYLMCDMQLFFCSPLVIFAMHYWEHTCLLGNYTGLKIWLAVMALFSFVPMTLTVINGMPPGHGISILYGIVNF